jgi:hypothetical protein
MQTNTGSSIVGDEYVVFVNFTRPLDLSGWTLSSSSGDVYEFGHIVLEPGEGLRLHSGEGENGRGHLYWGLSYQVWNEGDNKLVLRNAEGYVIDIYSGPAHRTSTLWGE